MAASKLLQNFLNEGRQHKFSLDLHHLSVGKKNHLARLMYEHGPKNNKFLFLPIDHGVEHGPSDFLPNPGCSDPEFQLSLAKEGDFSGIAIHIGLAVKYWQKKRYRHSVPLILKLNGKTNIPSADEAFSPLTSTVEDAVQLGADAVGYTLYVGSPRQDDDLLQYLKVRQAAEEAEIPLIMWAYPRGKYVNEWGGKDTFAAVAYAARIANELGADLTKINAPKSPKKPYDENGPYKKYNDFLDLSQEDQLKWAIRNAGNTAVLLSGGSKLGDDDLIAKVEMAMRAEADGLLFGRNMWQRDYDEALKISAKVKKVLEKY